MKEADYYEVLGVPFESSEEEIRRSYHGIVRRLHPDRQRQVSSGGGQAADGVEGFHRVQLAWRCLSDSTRRLLYDLRNFGRSSLEGAGDRADGEACEGSLARERLLELQREQALRDVRNMEVEVANILRREHASRGVVIHNALYGLLRLREECLEAFRGGGMGSIAKEDLVGPVVDVTVPMQSFVEHHSVILPGGASASKADLPGFYNPAPLDVDVELGLYVLYEFRGHLHEVNVGDWETLKLPYRKHVVPTGRAPRGPFSAANVPLLRRPSCGGGGLGGGGGGEKEVVEAADGMAVQRSSRRPSMAAPTTAAQALESSVVAYRLRQLAAGSPGEATTREFTRVFLLAGLTTTLAWWWAAGVGRHRTR